MWPGSALRGGTRVTRDEAAGVGGCGCVGKCQLLRSSRRAGTGERPSF